MDYMTIWPWPSLAALARATEESSRQAAEGSIVPIDWFWGQITSLNLLEALTFMSFGAVCLLYGWRVFKVLVVINFGLMGLVLGMTLTQKIFGPTYQLMGGLIGMGVLAVLSVPLMRWAVCILGAAAGGIITSGLWYACGLTEQYIWAGGLIGIVGGGMISFIIFKAAVILFSSMWGSGLVVSGALALLYIYPRTSEQIESTVFTLRWFLPLVLMVPTLAGIVVQHSFAKDSKNWNL